MNHQLSGSFNIKQKNYTQTYEVCSKSIANFEFSRAT